MKSEPKPIEQWEGLRVLTVREPWATLIVWGVKDVENRSRNFNHRGPLLIHASKGLTFAYYHDACRWITEHVVNLVSLPSFDMCKDNCGKIIGGCNLSFCTRHDHEVASDWWQGDCYALIMKEAWKALEPVAFKGQLCLGTFRKAVEL